MESRSLPVPDGLDGTRVDAALAKLLGFSRTFAAEVAASGGVRLDGVTLDKSDRLRGGAWLDVEWEPKEGPKIVPIAVPELGIVYDDDDIVVVDKPTGVAAHPSLGWEGPTVVGALAAAGFRVATSGAPERQGVVHRLDVGTSGLMVVAKSESAYTALKRAFKERTVEKIYHAVVQGHPDPLVGTIDAPIGRHPNHSWKFAVVPDGKPSVTHYETLEAFPGASLLEIHLETGRTHQIACTWRRTGTRASGTRSTAPIRRSPPASDSRGSGCTRISWHSPIRRRGSGCSSPRPIRRTSSTRWTCCAGNSSSAGASARRCPGCPPH